MSKRHLRPPRQPKCRALRRLLRRSYLNFHLSPTQASTTSSAATYNSVSTSASISTPTITSIGTSAITFSKLQPAPSWAPDPLWVFERTTDTPRGNQAPRGFRKDNRHPSWAPGLRNDKTCLSWALDDPLWVLRAKKRTTERTNVNGTKTKGDEQNVQIRTRRMRIIRNNYENYRQRVE